jgi:hypothetical protein
MLYYVINNTMPYKKYRLETRYKHNAIRAAIRISIYRGSADLVYENMCYVYIDGAFSHKTVFI